MNNCPLCGKPLKHIKNGSLIIPYKDINDTIKYGKIKDISYSECKNCDEQFFNPEQSELYDKKRQELEKQKVLNENKGDKQMKRKNESWSNVYEYLSKAFDKLANGYGHENVPKCLQTREILEKLTKLELEKTNQEYFEEDLQEALNRWFESTEDYKNRLEDILKLVVEELYETEQFDSIDITPDFTLSLKIKNEDEPLLITPIDFKEISYFDENGDLTFESEEIEDEDMINDIIEKVFEIVDNKKLNKTESYKREAKTDDIYFITDGMIYYFGKPEFFEEIAKEEGWEKDEDDRTAERFLKDHFTVIKLDSKELQNDFIKFE